MYLGLDRVCDLVMKGGVTSGVVYPPAIDAIARRAYLCGIGGTSAGAIAAALAAAAERRRRVGDPSGLEMLRDLPGEISAKGRLPALFKPDAATARAFDVFLRATTLKQHSGWLSRLRFYADVAFLVSTQRPLRHMVDNGMGLCTGMALDNRAGDDPLPPLTEWLSRKLDTFAGLAGGRPLTFGDLADAPFPPGLEASMTGATSINLQLVSTCLTFGRPYALPHLDRRFAFSPAEFRRLFPGDVVDYLEEVGGALAKQHEGDPGDAAPLPAHLLPLPVGRALPVIVAVRMSLSFPYLFTLVPLHYPNYNDPERRYERVYFSDGGITSNLPIHFFDSPFPRWPTLAINLQYADTPGRYGRPNVGDDKVWLAASYADGVLELFHRFLGSDTALGQALGLGGAIFRSAQTWSDNSFLVLPGYRDRVAEVWLDPSEGGMNLDMPEEVIRGLIARGRSAGEQLAERFFSTPVAEPGKPPPPSWDGHRWARYRSNMSALSAYLRALRRSVDHPRPADRSLWDLLAALDAPPNYRFGPTNSPPAQAQRAAAERATRDLMAFVAALDTAATCTDPGEAPFRPFCNGPRPEVALQTRAPLTPQN